MHTEMQSLDLISPENTRVEGLYIYFRDIGMAWAV